MDVELDPVALAKAERALNRRSAPVVKRRKIEQELKDPRLGLSAQQIIFVRTFARGGTQTEAAAAAGYGTPKQAGYALMQKPHVRAAVAAERASYAQSTGMTKKKVMEGFAEAIEIGRMKADPMAMVSGWREIARMCGYYEPVKHRLDIDVRGHVVVQKLQGMTDAELLKLAEGDSSVIEGEFIALGAENHADGLLPAPDDASGTE